MEGDLKKMEDNLKKNLKKHIKQAWAELCQAETGQGGKPQAQRKVIF